MESRNHIGGEWMKPTAGEFVAYNPFKTQEAVGGVYLSSKEDVLQAGEAAAAAFSKWAGMAPNARGEVLHRPRRCLKSVQKTQIWQVQRWVNLSPR